MKNKLNRIRKIKEAYSSGKSIADISTEFKMTSFYIRKNILKIKSDKSLRFGTDILSKRVYYNDFDFEYSAQPKKTTKYNNYSTNGIWE